MLVSDHSESYASVLENNLKAHCPRAPWELEAFLACVHDHASEVRGWIVSPMGYVEVAQNGVHADLIPAIYLVAAKGKTGALKNELERIFTNSMGGYGPSRSDVEHVWGMLDAASATR